MTGGTQGPTTPTPGRRHSPLAGSLAGLLAVGLALAAAPAAAAPSGAVSAGTTGAETYRLPASGAFALSGLGYGHGIGMSQFGAEGMGQQGHGYRQILGFYYPGTRLTTVRRDPSIRVALSSMTRREGGTTTATVVPGRRLKAWVGGDPLALPKQVKGGATVAYRVVRTDGGLAVRAYSSSKRVTLASGVSSAVAFGTAERLGRSRVTALSGGGSARTYHGQLLVRAATDGLLVMDTVSLEQYLRAVVSLEVPGTWTAAALRAQAVAARSYALMIRRNARVAGQRYDICDTTSCQVFGSMATESASEVDAVKATAGKYLESGGEPAFTQFSSANGGYSVAGSRPYLVAKPDPYDGVVTGAANWGHSWERLVTAAAVEATWPVIGSLQRLTILGRDGNGAWGGRVQSLALVGSKATVTVSGDSFRSALGLKSTWWVVTNAGTGTPEEPAPRQVTATPRDRSVAVTWERPRTKRAVSGYVVTVQPGGLTAEVGKSRRRAVFRGLVNGEAYRARVAAVYQTGAGDRARTPRVVPTSSKSYFRSITPIRLWSGKGVRRIADDGSVSLQVAGTGPVPEAGTRAAVLRVSVGGNRRGSAVAWRTGSHGKRLTAATFTAREDATGTISVPVSASGRVSLGVTAPAEFVTVDLVGYYTESGMRSWSFHGTPAAVAADSRRGVGLPQGRIHASTTNWVRVAGRNGVPAHGVQAVLVNATLVNPRADAVLAVASPKRPLGSGEVVRAREGTTRAAAAVVRVDSRGRIPLRLSTGRSHVRVDVLGWFGPQDGSAAGRYEAGEPFVVDPGRPIEAGAEVSVTVAGTGGVPRRADSVLVLVRASGADGGGWVSLRPLGTDAHRRPMVVLDDGVPARNLVAVPVGEDGRLEVAVSRQSVDVSLLVVGWYS